MFLEQWSIAKSWMIVGLSLVSSICFAHSGLLQKPRVFVLPDSVMLIRQCIHVQTLLGQLGHQQRALTSTLKNYDACIARSLNVPAYLSKKQETQMRLVAVVYDKAELEIAFAKALFSLQHENIMVLNKN